MASSLFINFAMNHTPIRRIPTKVTPKKAARNPLLVTNSLPELQFEEYKAIKIKQINKALDETIPLKQQHPTNLLEAMRYTLFTESNRLIPILCVASCEAAGGNESSAMSVACALEMIFTTAVIQDDLPCLDNDDLRRGKPANHKVFCERTSILACQALLCRAIEKIASDNRNTSSSRVRVIREICDAFGWRGVAAGQILDMESEGKEVSLSELEVIHFLKCGRFLEAAVACGAIMGGGSEVEISKLRNYGKLLGLAYQVYNDVMDVSGSTEKLVQGRDALRDKATSVKLRGVDESRKYAKELLVQADRELSYFDSVKAAPLHHIAHWLPSLF